MHCWSATSTQNESQVAEQQVGSIEQTVVQQFAVAFALFPPTALAATWTWTVLLWAAVVLAVVSGAQYLWHSRNPQRVDVAATVS